MTTRDIAGSVHQPVREFCGLLLDMGMEDVQITCTYREGTEYAGAQVKITPTVDAFNLAINSQPEGELVSRKRVTLPEIIEEIIRGM